MPKNMSAKTVTASELLEDDHFMLAGEMYRISEVATSNNLNCVTILFYPMDAVVAYDYSSIDAPADMQFDIYNQRN